MDLHLGDLTGTTLEVGYSGAYQGGSTVDIAADASAALAPTASGALSKTGGAAGTSALTAAGTADQPQADVLELGDLTGTTLELGYFAPTGTPGFVDIAANASAALTSYVWPYALTSHGEAHPNSIMAQAQFGTTGPVQLSLPTGGNASIVDVDFDRMDKEQGWRSDIEQYATTYQSGQVTYTFDYKIFETGATGSFDATVDVYTVVDAAGTAASAGVGDATASVGRNAAGTATAASTLVADGVYTQDIAGDAQSTLTPTAAVTVSRETGGSAAGAFTALNLGIDVSSDGASFMQSALSTAGDAHADKVSGGAGVAQLSVTGQPGQRTEVNIEAAALGSLTASAEATRTFSVASFQGSSLVATGAPTTPVPAAGTSTAASVGQGEPEVTRGVTGQGAAVLSTTGESSIGRDVSASPDSTLTVTGDAFIDRGFEVAANVVATSVGAGTPAYDAAAEGQGAAGSAGEAAPAVTKSFVGAGVAELFTNAVPGRDIEVFASGAAQLTAQGAAEAGLVIQAGGSGAASSTSEGAPAATISVAAQWASALVTVGQGATNQEAGGSAASQLRTAAETVGGTAVAPGALSVDKVSIIPSMSCYTKVVPAMYGDVAIRPK